MSHVPTIRTTHDPYHETTSTTEVHDQKRRRRCRRRRARRRRYATHPLPMNRQLHLRYSKATHIKHTRSKKEQPGSTHVKPSPVHFVSCVTVSSLHLRTLPQGRGVSSKTVFSHLSSHRVTPIRTLHTQPTLVAEQVTAHFVDSRLPARAHRTAEEARLPAPGSSRKRRDLLATE